MLELRPNCECCDRDLPPEAPDAMICTFELHLLPQLRERSVEQPMPELRRQSRRPADPARGKTAALSGVHETGAEAGRLRGDRLTDQ